MKWKYGTINNQEDYVCFSSLENWRIFLSKIFQCFSHHMYMHNAHCTIPTHVKGSIFIISSLVVKMSFFRFFYYCEDF
jgi:hypothetical protein